MRRIVAISLSVAAVAAFLALGSSPAAAADPTDDTVIAIRGNDNAVYVRIDEGTTPADPTFSPWMSLGGTTAHSPSVSVKNILAIRGIDGAVWIREHDDDANTWGAWTNLGGLTTDTPVLDANGSVAIRGIDGAVWIRHREGTYGPWQRIGGQITDGPSISATGLLVVRGTNNVVYVNRPATTSYEGWTSTGGLTRSRPVVRDTSSSVTIGIQGIDSSAWIRSVNPSTLAFTSEWIRYGGPIQGSPAVGAVVVMRGVDNLIYSADEPNGWIAHTQSAGADPIIARSGLVIRGADGAVWISSNDDIFTWTSLGGGTPSAPAGTPTEATAPG